MKKILMLIAVAFVALSFSSCKFVKTEAIVDVQVKNKLSAPVGFGEAVYIFSDGADYTDKTKAKYSRITDDAGVARFNLKSPIDFAPSWMADQEFTFFFATFDEEGNCTGYVAKTVESGSQYTITLKKSTL